MGSPVSAVIANMVIEDVELRALAISPVKPFSWKRYVDDPEMRQSAPYRIWIQ